MRILRACPDTPPPLPAPILNPASTLAQVRDLKYVKSEVYTPSGHGLGDGRGRKQYKIQVGFVKEAPHMDAQGFNLSIVTD